MEWEYDIQFVDENTIKIIDENFNLSPWVYSIQLGCKWHSVFIDDRIIKFNRNIKYYFDEVDRQELNDSTTSKKYKCKIVLDLYEFKKLQKIDKIIPGSVIAPILPGDNSLEKLEKDLMQKQKQIALLSSKLDNLENLLKKSIGF